MIFIDTETLGLNSILRLIKWAEDDGLIQLHEVWKQPIKKTLGLIEKFINHKGGLVFFNAAFDAFFLIKWYTIFSLVEDKNWIPEQHIHELVELEEKGRYVDI